MIDDFRVIQAQVNFEKDGSFVDLKDYCSNFSIEYGDVSGAGTQSNDGVPAVLSVVIKNDNNNNFNSLDRTSAWNKDLTGAYMPLLWNNRNVTIRANAFSTTLTTERITGNGSNIYKAQNANVVPFTVVTKDVWGIAPLMSTLGALTFQNNYMGQQLGTYDFNSLYEKTPSGSDMYHINCISKILLMSDIGALTFNDTYFEKVLKDYTWNEINGIQYLNFGEAIPTGVILDVQYLVTNGSDLITLFDGVMGDDISPSHSQVSLQMRDKTKVLQDAIINISSCRQYVAGGTPAAPTYTDPITSIVYNDGIPLEIYIQNLLNDVLGVGVMTLNTIGSPLYAITPTNDILQYQTLWNAIQGVVSSIGWYIGFRYKNEAEGMVLTLLEPPRTKNTADYALTYTDDFYICTGKFDFSSVRNKITVQYQDINGNNQSVTVQDATSISNNGLKELIITKEYTKGIVLSEDATNMANKILADLKSPRLYTQIEMPFLPDIQPFHTISLTYPRFSSNVEFYAVDSVRHDFDFQANRFRTILNCNTSVTGGQARWLNMAARPGIYQPSTANKLTEAYSYQSPTNITLSGAAIVFSGTAVNVTVDITFDKPFLDNPASYEIQYKKNTDATWDNAIKVVTKDLKTKLILSSNVQHNFRVASIAKNGDRGAWSGIVNYTPTGSTLTVTDADLAGERDDTLYIKSQAQMDVWVANVCNATAFAPDYSRVIITEGSYTIGGTSNRKRPININKNIFSIEGRGDVRILFYAYDELLGDIIKTNADTFALKNIYLSINKYWSGTPVILFRAVVLSVGDSPTTINNYLFENVKIEDANPGLFQVEYEILNMTSSNFTDATIVIEKCTLDVNLRISTADKTKSIIIKDNFINNKIIEVANAVVKSNTITSVLDYYMITCSNCIIDSNTFISNSISRPSEIIQVLENSTLTATNNNIIFPNSADVTTTKYFVNSTFAQVGNVVSNNVCIDKGISWLRKYGQATITSGTNTLTITGATFQTDLKIGQKIKIGTQERTIQSIPSQTSLTITTNWSSTLTSVDAYFQFAAIQDWFYPDVLGDSRNNIVVNNTNNSY